MINDWIVMIMDNEDTTFEKFYLLPKYVLMSLVFS
jgi:hypothetical protein